MARFSILAAVCALAGCMEGTSTERKGYTALPEVPLSTAVRLFDKYCTNARPNFTAASQFDPQVPIPEGPAFKVSTDPDGSKSCSMVVRTNTGGSLAALNQYFGTLRFLDNLPGGTSFFDGNGRGKVMYLPGAQNGSSVGTINLAISSRR